MFQENSFDYILFGLIMAYTLYILMKNNEQFCDVRSTAKQECSDTAINTQIFDYVLSELNQTKK